MDNSLKDLDGTLTQYLITFFESIGTATNESTVRVKALGIVHNQLLWSDFCQLENNQVEDQIFNVDNEYILIIFENISENYINQLHINEFGAIVIDEHFERIYRLWIMKSWLMQFSENDYSMDFQMVVEFVVRVIKPKDDCCGNNFLHLIGQFCEIIESSLMKMVSSKDFKKIYDELTQTFSIFRAKSEVFEKKVILFEKQQLKNNTAKLKASFYINEKLEGVKLPVWFYSFLEVHWHRLLHLHIIKHGEYSEEVQQGVDLLEKLIETINVNDPDILVEEFVTHITPLRLKVRELFRSVVIDESDLDAFLEHLESYHVNIMEGGGVCENMSIFFDDKLTKKAMRTLDSELLYFSKVGDWFRYQREELVYFCRVAFRNMLDQQLVLVNYSGAKVASLTFDEANDAWGEQRLQPLVLSSDYLVIHDNLQMYIEFQTASLKEQIQTKTQQQAKEKALQELAEKKIEVEKIEVQKREAKRRSEESDRRYQDKYSDSLILASQLVVGSVFLRKSQNDEEDLILNFAIRFKQSGKLLFVDQNGVKALELSPEEFAEHMAENNLELISLKEQTQSVLEEIVQRQRSIRAIRSKK